MAGATPQRTSYTSTEVAGALTPSWYRPIDPYIQPSFQLILTNNTVFVSTARGLYALDAATGDEKWVYATEMPLGNSPTVVNGVAYVGGFDRKIHAVDINTGQKISGWNSYEAGAGFNTNPLVINGMVIAGNRDGYMYALDATNGTLRWSYQTGGPILLSSATDGTNIFFASDDSYAYALTAANGTLVWKKRLPTSDGFLSWWPVVNGNTVLFNVTRAYRSITPGPLSNPDDVDFESIDPYQNLGNYQFNMQRIIDFFQPSQKPHRRVMYALNAQTGAEMDFNGDGVADPPPFLRFGTAGTGQPFPGRRR